MLTAEKEVIAVEDKSGVFLVSLVAIVALVGIVFLFSSGGRSAVVVSEPAVLGSGGNLGGQAYYWDDMFPRRGKRAYPVTSCNETDSYLGVKDIYEKGTCFMTTGSSYGILTDKCTSSKTLMEARCERRPDSQARCVFKGVICPKGYSCDNGACVRGGGSQPVPRYP